MAAVLTRWRLRSDAKADGAVESYQVAGRELLRMLIMWRLLLLLLLLLDVMGLLLLLDMLMLLVLLLVHVVLLGVEWVHHRLHVGVEPLGRKACRYIIVVGEQLDGCWCWR